MSEQKYMNETIKSILERRSIRSYENNTISHKKQ